MTPAFEFTVSQSESRNEENPDSSCLWVRWALWFSGRRQEEMSKLSRSGRGRQQNFAKAFIFFLEKGENQI